MLASKLSDYTRRQNFLKGNPFVNATPLSPHIKNAEALISNSHRRRYGNKNTIIYAGDQSDTLYYIIKGSVTVAIEDDDGKEIIVAYLNEGDFFGEMGLFDKDDPRSAWIRAKSDCEVAEISYGKFLNLVEDYPDLILSVSQQMASRLRRTTRKVGDLAFLM